MASTSSHKSMSTSMSAPEGIGNTPGHQCDNPSMAAADAQLLRRAWDAFAVGDIEAATQALDPQVRWYGADEPHAEGSCHSRDDAVAFIQRALADGVSAELLDLCEVGDRLVAIIQTHVPPEWGETPPPHGEVVNVRDGKVIEMVVYPTVDEAVAAAQSRGRPSRSPTA